MKKLFILMLSLCAGYAFTQNGNAFIDDELYVGEGTLVGNSWAVAHFQNQNTGVGSALYLQNADSGFTGLDGAQFSLTSGVTPDISIYNREGGGIHLVNSALGQQFAVDANGFVGIGTLTPSKNLDLAANGADIRFSDSNFSAIQWYESGSEVGYVTHNDNDMFMHNRDTGNLNLYSEEGRMRMEPGGDLIIGTTIGSPTYELDEQGSGATRSGLMEINNYNFTATNKRAFLLDANGSANEPFLILYNADGSEAIKLDADVSGDARIETDEILIRGGADFAEHFDIIEDLTVPVPGMVVSIDPNSTGKLTIADEQYDRKVAGIISGANGVEPGMMMGQEGSIADGDYPIALTGRVYVYTNEENGEITPGDLLTTSSQKGYAMKVGDYKKAQGAIIGKAMTKVDENGFVLVLVNLQ